MKKETNLKEEVKALIPEFFKNSSLFADHDDELKGFVRLLFDEGESIQVKRSKFIHPFDADYILVDKELSEFDDYYQCTDPDGYSFCCNPVPNHFLNCIHEITKHESTEKRTFIEIAQGLKEELSLSGDLFNHGRTFFVEADSDANGHPLETTEAKLAYLREIIGMELPFSYILDTGGKGPHIGIVLQEKLTPVEFQKIVKEILARLPPWIDIAVGRINQMERLPGTYRINKKNEQVPVDLLYIGSRVTNASILEWIETHPILNPKVTFRTCTHSDDHHSYYGIDPDDAEDAAWRFVAEHKLNHGSYRNGKIAVSCPNSEKHRSGKDSNMSAFINVETGLVWCSGCQSRVGKTFFKNFFIETAIEKNIQVKKLF